MQPALAHLGNMLRSSSTDTPQLVFLQECTFENLNTIANLEVHVEVEFGSEPSAARL